FEGAYMPVLKFSAAVICLSTVTQAVSSTDYIFANSFEVECDGGSCTYCSPANPVAVCGANSHCSPHINTTSVCSYPAGPGGSGAACTSLSDCGGSLACVNTGTA